MKLVEIFIEVWYNITATNIVSLHPKCNGYALWYANTRGRFFILFYFDINKANVICI